MNSQKGLGHLKMLEHGDNYGDIQSAKTKLKNREREEDCRLRLDASGTTMCTPGK
jgi:hypothetical protein